MASCFLILALGQCVMDAAGTPAFTLGRTAVASMASAAKTTPMEKRFLAVPSAESARASLKHITSRPHVAGTPGDFAMATFVRDELIKAGISNAAIDPQRVLLTYPLNRSLDLVDEHGKVLLRAPLSEAILPSDPTSDTWWRNHSFNAYSPSGDVTARVVYANYGFPEDFAALSAAGVEVRGAIVLMRYGKNFRGLKAMNAESNGALAALIYSDPEDDGYAKGSVYPEGPWRPPSSVQRGSIQFISLSPEIPRDRTSPTAASSGSAATTRRNSSLASRRCPSRTRMPHLSYEPWAVPPLRSTFTAASTSPTDSDQQKVTFRPTSL